jgi:hypothetical protein
LKGMKFEQRSDVEVKGKGKMVTYWLSWDWNAKEMLLKLSIACDFMFSIYPCSESIGHEWVNFNFNGWYIDQVVVAVVAVVAVAAVVVSCKRHEANTKHTLTCISQEIW